MWMAGSSPAMTAGEHFSVAPYPLASAMNLG
jgi:hypothetical protein